MKIQKIDRPLFHVLLVIGALLLLNIFLIWSPHSAPKIPPDTKVQKIEVLPELGTVAGRPLYAQISCEHGCGYSEDDKGWWSKLLTDPVATFTGFTVFLVGISFWQGWLTRQSINLARVDSERQARDMESAIAAAEAANKISQGNAIASRRAWISIEDIKLVHPTSITDKGIHWKVEAILKNLGQTPATSVWIDFESYFAEGNSESFADATKRFKAQTRNRPPMMGEMLFPGDTLLERRQWGDGIEKFEFSVKTLPSGEKHVGIMVFVGVSYRIVGDNTTHVTYQAYLMLNTPIGLALKNGEVAEPPRMPFLAGEAD